MPYVDDISDRRIEQAWRGGSDEIKKLLDTLFPDICAALRVSDSGLLPVVLNSLGQIDHKLSLERIGLQVLMYGPYRQQAIFLPKTIGWDSTRVVRWELRTDPIDQRQMLVPVAEP